MMWIIKQKHRAKAGGRAVFSTVGTAILAAILAGALVVALAGCGQAASGPKGEPEGSAGAVSITVVSPFDESDGNRENYVRAYEAYEQQTGNIINDQSSASNEAWKQKVLSDFVSGSEPDVLFFFTGADADQLVQNKQVVSIADIRREYSDYAENMKDSLLPVSGVDGRQYAVPVNGFWEGLYVNKQVLEDCGVEIPGAITTWEEFLEDCRVIKEKGYTPIAASLQEIPHYWFEFCTFNHGSIANHASIPGSADDAIATIWADGLGDIKDLYEQGFFPENTTAMSDAEANALMVENKAAFMLDGSWKLGWFALNTSELDNFAVTYVPARGERKPTDIVGGLSMGYYITSKAWNDPEKRQACVDFVRQMTTDEVVSSFGALAITALKAGTTSPEETDALTRSALDMTGGCTGIVQAAQDGLGTAARDLLFGDVSAIATGSLTPKQAIADCLAANSA